MEVIHRHAQVSSAGDRANLREGSELSPALGARAGRPCFRDRVFQIALFGGRG